MEIFLLSRYEFNVSMFPDVFHRFSENRIIHQFEEILLEIVGSCRSLLSVEIYVKSLTMAIDRVLSLDVSYVESIRVVVLDSMLECG